MKAILENIETGEIVSTQIFNEKKYRLVIFSENSVVHSNESGDKASNFNLGLLLNAAQKHPDLTRDVLLTFHEQQKSGGLDTNKIANIASKLIGKDTSDVLQLVSFASDIAKAFKKGKKEKEEKPKELPVETIEANVEIVNVNDHVQLNLEMFAEKSRAFRYFQLDQIINAPVTFKMTNLETCTYPEGFKKGEQCFYFLTFDENKKMFFNKEMDRWSETASSDHWAPEITKKSDGKAKYGMVLHVDRHEPAPGCRVIGRSALIIL